MSRRRRSRPTAERGRGRRDGLDAYELAVLRGGRDFASDPEAEDGSPPPLPKLRIGNFRVGPLGFALGLLGIVLIGSTVRLNGGRKPPDLTASCQVPALAVSTPTIRRGGALRWTTVGPGDRVVVAIDAATVAADGTATPLAGHGETQVVQPKVLDHCKVSGILGVQVQPGEHVIGVFPATGGAALATQPLTVTPR